MLRTCFPFLPTSHYTPGPGAYTQHTTFGAPSGATRKSYFGTRKGDVKEKKPDEK